MSTQLKSLSMSAVGRKGLSLIFILPLAVMLSSAVTGTSNYLFLLVNAGIIFFAILTSFPVALLLIALASYIFPFAVGYFHLPGPMINFGYVLIVMMLLREYFFTAGFVPIRTPINYLLISIIAVSFLSIIYGDTGAYPAFKGMLKHVSFPLLFLLILMAEPDEELMKKLVIGIILYAFLQVVASGWQFTYYSTINPKDPGTRADLSGGLLGFSCGGHTAVLMAMTFCLVLGFILVRGFRLNLGIGLILLLIPVYLASARAGVLFFALAVPFMLLVAPLPRHGPFSKRFLVSVALFAFIVGVVQLGLGGESFRVIFNPNYAYDYSIGQSDSGMGRLQAFDIVTRELRTPLEKLVGRGPGMLTPTSIVNNPNSLVAQNPVLFDNVTGYAYTTIELGFLGLALFLLMFIQMYRFNRRFLKKIDDPFWESISLGFCGLTFIFIISSIYVDAWIYYPLSFTYWGMAAALYRVGVIRGIAAQ